jgi:hypothetical protein
VAVKESSYDVAVKESFYEVAVVQPWALLKVVGDA